MKESHDLYEELGVMPDASDGEIKRAYRNRAKRTHPDTGAAAEDFARLRHAYLVLIDPVARARYNRTGEDEEPGISQLENLALETISVALSRIINADPRIVAGDTITELTAYFARCRKEIEDRQAQLKQRRERGERIVSRIKPKKTGNNIIERLIGHQLSKLDEAIKILDEEILKYNRILEIVSEYETG